MGLAFAALALLLPNLLGVFAFLRERSTLWARLEFAVEYRSKFNEWMNGRSSNPELYEWLLRRSNRMQEDMGNLGLMQAFQPPYKNIVFRDWPIILNAIPEIRSLSEITHANSQIIGYANIVSDALARYIGTIEHENENLIAEIKNPLTLFAKGVRLILSMPFYVLSGLGIVSEQRTVNIVDSRPFKFLSGCVGLVNFLAAVAQVFVWFGVPQFHW